MLFQFNQLPGSIEFFSRYMEGKVEIRGEMEKFYQGW